MARSVPARALWRDPLSRWSPLPGRTEAAPTPLATLGRSVAAGCPDPARWSGCLHMEVLRPTALAEALEARAAHPEALPIAGGTDVMVELNFDKARPPAILDLTAVPELATIERDERRRAHRRRPSPTRASSTSSRTSCPRSPRPRAPSARRPSATAPRSAATSGRPRPPATPTRRCSPRARPSRSRRPSGTRTIAAERVLHRPRPVRPASPTSSSPPSRSRSPGAGSSSPRSAPATRW